MAAQILLGVAIVLVVAALAFGNQISARMATHSQHTLHPALVPGTAIALAFALLVAGGISGTSAGLLLNGGTLVDGRVDTLYGDARPVRSDEWLVLTSYALAQADHTPPFPVVNRNLGSDGQNMLVSHMSSVPVWHLSLLAKPATWGFFLLDLNRALAWYWWFPLFFCGFALWWLFGILLPDRWRLGLALAAWFCASAYVTAWSYWPAYAVAFPAVALAAAISILRTGHRGILALLALLLGCAIAGFVLILYPPWQVSLGYLFLALAAGLVARDRLWQQLNPARFAALGAGIALAATILVAWWHSAAPAIDSMLATVYPGQRTALEGGGFGLQGLFRGVTNVITLYTRSEAPSVWFGNPSESASFIYYLGPLAMLVALTARHRIRQHVVLFAVAAFVAWVLYFQTIGVSPAIGELTLWGRVPVKRAELALGLAQVILIGLLAAQQRERIRPLPAGLAALALLTAIAWATASNAALNQARSLLDIGPGVRAALFVLLLTGSVWLLWGHYRRFLWLNGIWSAVAVIPFNPIVVMPQTVQPGAGVQRIQQATSPQAGARVLVIGGQKSAMQLLAAGVPVANGVFFYPPIGFWSNLDPVGERSSIYNRYQHLIAGMQVHGKPGGFVITSPQRDVVRLTIDPRCFDFRLTTAQLLAVPDAQTVGLDSNPSVSYAGSTAAWRWYRIDPSVDPKIYDAACHQAQ